MAMTQNTLAKSFKALHKPSSPLILANVYDAPSARAVASLVAAKAIATASYAVANAVGIEDDDMSIEANLAAVKAVVAATRVFEKPITIDFQDGYGEQLEDGISKLIDLGVVGINLEDYDKEAKVMYSVDEATDRIRKVLVIAKRRGVPDFVVNARCDTLVHGGGLPEVWTGISLCWCYECICLGRVLPGRNHS